MPQPPKPTRLAPEKQTLLDKLLNENSEGTISDADRAVLLELVAEAERLMVENAKQLADFAEQESPAVPGNAVPVTVWVKPSSTE